MTLIKSISGIRGTIGGKPGDAFTPLDIVKFTSAYGAWIRERNPSVSSLKVIVGRDARPSGEMVRGIVVSTLQSLGIDVVDLGLSTTPTVEVAVTGEKADGGIILTASHNPVQWNALKLLNEKGEFISAADGARVLEIAEQEAWSFAGVDKLGKLTVDNSWIKKHIDLILAMPLVDKKAIAAAKFRVVVDAVNSTGGIAVPLLLKELGVTEVIELYCEPHGRFPHNPEPLPEHLKDISEEMRTAGAHVGVVVDPDVDRLALVCEDGSMFGEEYTLVAVADYVLKHQKGNTVSNLSSTRALRDVTGKAGGCYFASAVGEVNVVEMMKKHQAVIGGEGNGGVIYPGLHYGRDALAGIALFLSHLAKSGMKCSQLRASYPDYYISKNKIELEPGMDVDGILADLKEKFSSQPSNTTDGLKLEFDKEWVHLRKSNTEPIIRIYAESARPETADQLAQRIMNHIRQIAGLV